MKNLKTTISIVVISLITIFTSCKKTSTSDPTPAVVTADGFTYSENGSSTIKQGFQPSFLPQSHSLFVYTSAAPSAAILFEFSLTTLAVGTYNLGPNYNIDYPANPGFNPTAGSFIITSNANDKISGTFTSSGSAGSISAVKGTFNNITIQ